MYKAVRYNGDIARDLHFHSDALASLRRWLKLDDEQFNVIADQIEFGYADDEYNFIPMHEYI